MPASSARGARGFAAWLGLTPRQNNSGGKRRSGGISKQGERHIRTLLILGASAHLRHEPHRKVKDPWLAGLMARIIWALLVTGERYRAQARLAA